MKGQKSASEWQWQWQYVGQTTTSYLQVSVQMHEGKDEEDRWGYYDVIIWTKVCKDQVCFTFDVSIPVFPVGQVHVDVCIQLWAAGGEHTQDFVLIKPRFLKTAQESSRVLQAPRHTPRYSTQLIPKHTTLIRASVLHPASLASVQSQE